MEYTIADKRQLIREIVREAKNTAKVDTGYLQRSIRGDVDKDGSIEFRQMFYGAKDGNSKLEQIAEKRMPKDISWKIILIGNEDGEEKVDEVINIKIDIFSDDIPKKENTSILKSILYFFRGKSK